ncbi:unnamed protein product [Musa acuminata subsp. malaccensis]|uniref:Protein EARLY HEADING DATE 2 n=1 Tax=Musa acuminata subsp. malaccensis TaxID=214687 RepID=A0A804IC93_MUSAM|nr:PREDICTED: protein indeterminate-domain 2-like [Musa acuminata subsp. malaccensis]CAG1850187.1 unnamed protein product [Musa acuminata subsp. malaccensis]
MAAASSSVPLFGIREGGEQYNKPPPPPTNQQSSSSAPIAPKKKKKKRNLPGNPNPDAEVIALSPKTLLATNRFICEVCNKGFQREQNLQLHRRGHNLPWKLKQKNPKEARRRVYLCPETTCVHHDPSRALGDLTGIKKHYCRKHGEKKWKCDRCSKRYAVQSDWKAHAKTCGTREYRCDCGTLFSRRDSFITHRAFCDALAQESARLPSGMSAIGSHLYGNSSINLGLPPVNSHVSSFQSQSLPSADLGRAPFQFDHLSSSAFRSPQPRSSPLYLGGGSSQEFGGDPQILENKTFSGLIQDMQTTSSSSSAAAAGSLFDLSFFSDGRGMCAMNSIDGNSEPAKLFDGNPMRNNNNIDVSCLLASSVHNESAAAPLMSATALLQKAAQMGVTSSGRCGSSFLTGFGSTYSSGSGGSKHANHRDEFRSSGPGQGSRTQVENENHFQNLMFSLANGSSGIFGGGNERETGLGGFGPGLCNLSSGGMGGADGLTRDFLGVGGVMRSMGAGARQRGGEVGVAMAGALDSETKSGHCSLPSTDGSLQSRRNNP